MATKHWVGNCPPNPPATYAPVRWGRRLFRPEVLNSSVFIWFWLIVDRWDVIRISDEKKLMTTELFKESDRKSNKLSPISTWNFVCYKSLSFFISKQITFEVQNSNAGPYWGKSAAQVSNKIDLRHGWNLLLKSTMYSDCSIYTLVLMLYARDG